MLRRIAAAACAGLAVLFALGTVTAYIATVPVVVAIRHISRGSTVNPTDVAVRHFPPSVVSDSMIGAVDDAAGRIASIDITNGDPILTHMTRAAPMVPAGSTVMDVQLTSSIDELVVGDTVQLVSAFGCGTDADRTITNEIKGDSCILADDALVMGISTTADSSYADGRQLVSFAMAPDAAARVMQLQEAGAIVAVMQ
ncbi:flagella basal body P-ring formation protein FlgA [Bifidobacterium cebidarum]|nr:flagella basal body P-ring formation protein FlgA [Bifidobacterium cebidarum]